jgi:hypothetical protein
LGATSVIFFVVKICHFAIKKKPQATCLRQFFGKFQKKSPHLEEESYKIPKIFGGFA